MKLVGSAEQHVRHSTFQADGSIASATLPQLVLPENTSRSSLFFQNTSTATIWYGFGSARATCTISGGVVNAVTVTNGGFNFTRAPVVQFLGGGILSQQGIIPANSSYVGAGGPGFPSPSNPATGHAVLTGTAVTSIVIDNPGSGYVTAPYVFLYNSVLDPNGCFDPSRSSGSGFQLFPGQSIYESHTAVTTDPLAVFCATLTSTFACRWMT